MARKLFIVIILILISYNAIATEREEIAKCSTNKASAERLVCFDTLAKAIGVDKPITETTTGKGKWIVSTEKSPINDSTNVVLLLSSEQEVHSGYETVSPTLVIRCNEGETNAYISWNLYLGIDSTTMLTRLDKNPASTKTVSISTNNKAVFMPGSGISFAKQLSSHKTLLTQITPYSQNPVMATFDVNGLPDAIKPLRAACKW
jgi:type VI secretion system protein VasI